MNLRQAAEMALEALRNAEVVHMEQLNAMYALQEALAEPEYQYEVVAMHENGTRTIKQTLIQKREWVGLTADEIWKCNKAKTGSDVEFHICSAHQNVMDFAEAIEAKLKEKNCDT